MTARDLMAPVATMTSREIAEVEKCQAMAAEFYPRVFPEIAAMSREEMALLLHGLACKVELIKSEWKFRESYAPEIQSSECPRVSSLFSALEDYKSLSYVEDCRWQLEKALEKSNGLGSVYVMEFSDGHIKIGCSITPAKRIKSVAGGNQHSLIRSWISDPLAGHHKLESAAHRNFKEQRVGGEFFSTPYREAVTWIAGEWAKHQVAAQLELS